jgi:esterase/lipase superfamily enzyme
MKFNPETPLYTSDTQGWRMDQFDAVMSKVLVDGKPVVLFVHGRGKEPGKGLLGATFTEGKAVHKIERGYDVNVLMFNWDSAFKGLSFLDREVPLSHTSAGGAAFGRVLVALQQYQAQHPNTRKPALLVHSMGSVVVQKAVTEGHWPQTKGLFSAVLLSQPDADDVGHAQWLDEVATREETFLTLNRDDHVLRRSTDARPAGAHALGLDTTQPLARHATYVDISNMGATGQKDEDHEVFGKGAMNQQIFLCQFFTQALTGHAVVLDPATNVESVERGVVHRLRDKRQPGAPCLKLPELPEVERLFRAGMAPG